MIELVFKGTSPSDVLLQVSQFSQALYDWDDQPDEQGQEKLEEVAKTAKVEVKGESEREVSKSAPQASSGEIKRGRGRPPKKKEAIPAAAEMSAIPEEQLKEDEDDETSPGEGPTPLQSAPVAQPQAPAKVVASAPPPSVQETADAPNKAEAYNVLVEVSKKLGKAAATELMRKLGATHWSVLPAAKYGDLITEGHTLLGPVGATKASADVFE